MEYQEELIEQTMLNGEICPFCKKSDLKISRSDVGYQIKCNHCKRHTGSYPDIDTLVDVWNIFCGGTINRSLTNV